MGVSSCLHHLNDGTMRAIIHFSAFEQTGEDEFIVKELAIVNPDVNTVQSWMFKAPFDISQLPLTLQFDNEYLAMHIFGVDWSDGDVAYKDLQRILTNYTKHIPVLYTHGHRRQQFLQRMLGRSVMNLEDLHCPKSSKLLFPESHCAHRHHQFHTFRCALYEALCYSKYLTYHDLSQYVTPEPKSVYNPTPITPSPSVLHEDDEEECHSV